METTITTPEELLALRDKDGFIRVEHDLRIECDIPWPAGKEIAGLYVGGNLDVGGYLDVGGDYLIITGDLFWSHASMPKLPERSYIRRVLPHEWQRDYYQERLGMDISDGCYDEICRAVYKQIVNLLRDEKWTSTERWMLETLRDSKKELPDWAVEVREQEKEIA